MADPNLTNEELLRRIAEIAPTIIGTVNEDGTLTVRLAASQVYLLKVPIMEGLLKQYHDQLPLAAETIEEGDICSLTGAMVYVAVPEKYQTFSGVAQNKAQRGEPVIVLASNSPAQIYLVEKS